MKKVLHLINGEFYAGAERVQDLLAMSLPDHGFEVGFACTKPGAFARLRQAQHVALHEVAMSSRFDLSIVRRMLQLVAQERYVAIHGHTVRSSLIGRFVAAQSGIPFIHHVHSPTRRETEAGLRNRVNAWVEERVVWPAATRMLAVSGSLRDYLLAHGVPDAQVCVVPNGVPVREHRQGGWSAPVPGQDWTLGTVALFRPRKGLEVLLPALAELRRAGVAVRLLAVGGFETPFYEQEMKNLAVQLGIAEAIEWTGFTSDVPAQLERMHLFTLPSLFGEGLPMVVIEAMSIGVPVVSTDVEGIPQVLSGHGEAGRVVAAGSSEALARGLRDVIEHVELAASLSVRGQQVQRAHYSDRSMAAGVAAVYRDVLGM